MSQLIPLWPWGALLLIFLSFCIGWLINEWIFRKKIEILRGTIERQENVFIRLARKYFDVIDTTENSETEKVNHRSEEDTKINSLEDEIVRLKIQNQKLSNVPQSLYLEKIAEQKSEIKELRKKMHKTGSRKDQMIQLQEELKSYKKKLKKERNKQQLVKKVIVREEIDFLKLRKILEKPPVKTTKFSETIEKSSQKGKKKKKKKKKNKKASSNS
jgi:hypothetical protein